LVIPFTIAHIILTIICQIERISIQPKLFVSERDMIAAQVFSAFNNSSIRTKGTEIIFGRIYESIGFGDIKEEFFPHLAIARLVFPLSKLKTIGYV
jgi:hypothetical protein